MGLLDLFLSEEKRIHRHIRRLTNRDAQPEDREASAHWLLANRSRPALMGLLSRFDMNLDHQFKDANEKEFLFGLLSSLGDEGIEPTQAWLRQCKQFANPLRLLEDLAGRQAAVDSAFEMLEIEYAKDDFKPEKKKALLVWATDVRDPRFLELAAKFLQDFDEGVRYAAAEVTIAQESDEARLPLLRTVANPKEESIRLKVRIAEVFASRRWSITEEAEDLAAGLPPGFEIKGDRLVSKR